MKMIHRERAKIPAANEIPKDANIAGVLILMYPSEQCITLVFMKRSEYDGVHSGQISFPGGKKEEDDQDVMETAVREAEEEIGVNRRGINILGELTDLYIPPSHFRVTPTVAFTLSRPSFVPDPDEVAEIIEIKLPDLLSEDSLQRRDIDLGAGFTINAPCYYINNHVIWGATSMILTEFLEVLKGSDITIRCSDKI
jgi:8-oxo-dGTP pyrophosphatase MutT (NUDIX family)